MKNLTIRELKEVIDELIRTNAVTGDEPVIFVGDIEGSIKKLNIVETALDSKTRSLLLCDEYV